MRGDVLDHQAAPGRSSVAAPPAVHKSAKRSAVAVEQLDHRRLLSVNFTGNVATDFPATESPGVVIFNSSNTPGSRCPSSHRMFSSLIKTSGYAISEIRVSYDSTDDTLSVGFESAARRTRRNPHRIGDRGRCG